MKSILFLAALLAGCTGCAQLNARRDPARADFLKVINHPPVDPAVQFAELPARENLAEFHFSFASDPSNRVTGILIKRTDSAGRRPVVIALHGTGGSKNDQLGFCRQMARRGFVAVAIDGRYHGERKSAQGQIDYNNAMVRAWNGSGEHPFFFDTVWDILKLIDYLQTRDDVDPHRIGLTGISKGGIETYLAAAADPRIAVAVPEIGLESFHWALANNDWQGRIGTIQPAFDAVVQREGVAHPDSAFVKRFYDRVAPGIDGEFDGPQMVRLIAPRPLLVINSDSDNHTPLPGLNECLDAARSAYSAAAAPERLKIIIQPKTGHAVRPASVQAAEDWFVAWLKP